MPLIRKLLVSTALAVAAYVSWVIPSDAGAVLDAVSRIGAAGIALICALSLLNYALRFLRWQWYLSLFGAAVPWRRSLTYYLAGFALTTTPGKAGEAIRSVYLREYGVPVPASLAALLAERLADIFAVVVISAFGLAAFAQFRWLAPAVLGVACIGLLLLHSPLPERLLTAQAGGSGWRRALRHGAQMVVQAKRLLGGRAILVGSGIGLVAWGAEAWAFAFLLETLGYPIPVLLGSAVYAIGMLAGAASFMPGGVGGAEAAMALMLLALSVSAPDAVAATLVCRLCTLWLAVGIGAVAMLWAGSAAERLEAATAEGSRTPS